MKAVMLRYRDDGWQRRGRLAVYGMSKRASPPADRSALRRFVDRSQSLEHQGSSHQRWQNSGKSATLK
jgi:hypothetical protein